MAWSSADPRQRAVMDAGLALARCLDTAEGCDGDTCWRCGLRLPEEEQCETVAGNLCMPCTEAVRATCTACGAACGVRAIEEAGMLLLGRLEDAPDDAEGRIVEVDLDDEAWGTYRVFLCPACGGDGTLIVELALGGLARSPMLAGPPP